MKPNRFGERRSRKTAVRLGVAAALSAFVLAIAGCGSGERTPAEQAGSAPAGAALVRLVISLPGDDMAGTAELALRERIRSRLDERGIGAFAGASTGRGYMEVSFSVSDTGRARRAMEVVMAAEAPRMRYRVRTED